MENFRVKKAQSGNLIISELNANVADRTFNTSEKYQLGDLYYSPNECPLVVKHNSCPPVNGTFIKVIDVEFL